MTISAGLLKPSETNGLLAPWTSEILLATPRSLENESLLLEGRRRIANLTHLVAFTSWDRLVSSGEKLQKKTLDGEVSAVLTAGNAAREDTKRSVLDFEDMATSTSSSIKRDIYNPIINERDDPYGCSGGGQQTCLALVIEDA